MCLKYSESDCRKKKRGSKKDGYFSEREGLVCALDVLV